MGTAHNTDDDFPWHLGVFDAHCHPTDMMTSIPSLPTMKARCLTVMGTRAQDQHLVAQVADQYGVKSKNYDEWKRDECMVPCFGWHPWFAHTMYLDDDDSDPAREQTHALQGASKISHYQSVLAPKREPPTDHDKQTYLSLPDPTPFSAFLAHTRENLEHYPLALVGEIGLDRSFRIPEASPSDRPASDLTPGGREGRRLTPFRCAPAHQREIFRRQLLLAAQMGRAVSVHGVQAHGLVFETIKELWGAHQLPVLSKREQKKKKKKEEEEEEEEEGRGTDDASAAADCASPPSATGKYPPRICLHSYSGGPDAFRQYLHPGIPVAFFASFSTAVNLGDGLARETPEAFVRMVETVPDEMLLVESDLHTAGKEMDRRLEDMTRRICGIKGWELEEGVERLGRNWRRFVFGTEG